jgi:hypothetical protein
VTAEPKQRPVERGVQPRSGEPGPEPAIAEPDSHTRYDADAVYDSAEAAVVAERLEALGYIE